MLDCGRTLEQVELNHHGALRIPAGVGREERETTCSGRHRSWMEEWKPHGVACDIRVHGWHVSSRLRVGTKQVNPAAEKIPTSQTPRRNSETSSGGVSFLPCAALGGDHANLAAGMKPRGRVRHQIIC